MTFIVLTLLVLASVAVLAYPFWAERRGSARFDDPARDLEEGARRARDRVYEEMRALQQERFLSNAGEEQYRAQLQAARVRAAELIREQRRARETADAIERGVDAELRAAANDPANAPANDGKDEA